MVAFLKNHFDQNSGGSSPAPLFLDQTEVRRAEKFFFRDRAPLALLPVSHGLDDRPPPPPPPRHPLSEGLDHYRPRFHLTLTLHCINCITAIHKSRKGLAIVTGKGKADNRVDSTVCVSHKQGDTKRYPKLTIQSDFWYKIKYC